MAITEAIVVSYNDQKHLLPCVEAISRAEGEIQRIHIVHNSPVTEAEDFDQFSVPIKHHFPGHNLGFGSAVNLAVKELNKGCEFIITINPDCRLNSKWIAPALNILNSDKAIASVGCDLHYLVGKTKVIDGLGDVLTKFGLGRRTGHGLPSVITELIRPEKIDSVCAALAIYRRSYFEELGGFDSKYFLYLEDIDLGIRFEISGYKNVQLGGYSSLHFGSQSSGGHCSSIAAYYGQRNRYLLASKGLSGKTNVNPIFWAFGDCMMLFKATICGNFVAHLRGTFAGWKILFGNSLRGKHQGGK